MEIVSWNIQAAKGVDGVTSVERIASEIRDFSSADLICLQEVLCTPADDQVAQFSALFPNHTPVFGAAIDRLHPQGRLTFGNMILSRLPIQQIVQHKLPQPAEPDSKHMPRQAIEAILRFGDEFLRVTTLHLDYFAKQQRNAQVRYLANHHAECLDRFERPSPQGGSDQFESMVETSYSIYCGDFNLTVDSVDYRDITQAGENHELIDCWRHLHEDTPHDPTCGIFDHVQWQEGAHCRDFFFASRDVANRLTGLEVNQESAASDHQPLKISLGIL